MQRRPEKSGLRIPHSRNPRAHTALHHVATEPALHQRDPLQVLVVLVGWKKAVGISVRNVTGYADGRNYANGQMRAYQELAETPAAQRTVFRSFASGTM